VARAGTGEAGLQASYQSLRYALRQIRHIVRSMIFLLYRYTPVLRQRGYGNPGCFHSQGEWCFIMLVFDYIILILKTVVHVVNFINS